MLALAGAQDSTVTIPTPDGPLTGLLLDTHIAFIGVPYAAPPVGPLRWAPPAPPAPWTSPRDAVEDPPGCPQVCTTDEPPHICPQVQDEDCLYLNVYLPRVPGPTPAPVLIFSHGGNFHDGAIGGRNLTGPLLYDGQEVANSTGAILVTIQYRLGALGFLYTGGATKNTTILGNYGLMDQVFAFQWVQRSIAAFGGDKGKVAIQGQSAGAMSASIHLSRPETAGLYAAAIEHSNPFAEPYRAPPSALGLASAFANYSGCGTPDVNGTDWSGVEACLRGVNYSNIVVAQALSELDLSVDGNALLQAVVAWGPTVRTDYLPLRPMEAFQSGAINDVPIIVGTTSEEAVIFVYEALATNMSAFQYDVFLSLLFGSDDVSPVNALYPLPDPIPQDLRLFSSVPMTDALFLCPTRNATLAMQAAAPARKSKSYHYTYSHVLSWASEAWGGNYTIW